MSDRKELIEKINQHKQRIELAIQKKDSVLLVQIMEELRAMPITLKDLEDTKIGITVSGLREMDDADVSGLASSLITLWKKVVRDDILSQEVSDSSSDEEEVEMTLKVGPNNTFEFVIADTNDFGSPPLSFNGDTDGDDQYGSPSSVKNESD